MSTPRVAGFFRRLNLNVPALRGCLARLPEGEVPPLKYGTFTSPPWKGKANYPIARRNYRKQRNEKAANTPFKVRAVGILVPDFGLGGFDTRSP
jgi:hypothetical protein